MCYSLTGHSALLGPIGAVCINRTLERHFMVAWGEGLGRHADWVCATLAIVGFASFFGILTGNDIPMRLPGGFFMLYYGLEDIQATPRVVAERCRSIWSGRTATTFFLTSPKTG